MENPQQIDSTTPTGPPARPVPEKRKSRRFLTFLLGLIAGLGLAVAWPKLAPLATCLQDIAQNEFPIKTGTEGNDEWIKFYGEMRPVGKWDRAFAPTFNQLMDFWFKHRRPPAPYPNARQEDKDAYPAVLEEWKERMCKIEGLCAVQADTSGAAASPSMPGE